MGYRDIAGTGAAAFALVLAVGVWLLDSGRTDLDRWLTSLAYENRQQIAVIQQ